jgi:hypothetical protein
VALWMSFVWGRDCPFRPETARPGGPFLCPLVPEQRH